MISLRTQHNTHRFSTQGIRFIKEVDLDIIIQYDHVTVALECVDDREVVKILRTIDEYIQKDIIK